MSQSARPRPERKPTPRLSEHRAQALRWLRDATHRLRINVARFSRTLAHRWRSSLQLRVVSSTMLLGLVVVMLLGGYLYKSISDGLEHDPEKPEIVVTVRGVGYKAGPS